jgi:hypothetical protein
MYCYRLLRRRSILWLGKICIRNQPPMNADLRGRLLKIGARPRSHRFHSFERKAQAGPAAGFAGLNIL